MIYPEIVHVFDGLGKTRISPFIVIHGSTATGSTSEMPQVKHDDMSSKVFGWLDFFVFVLLTFALGFATNAKMYALLLGNFWAKGGKTATWTHECQRGGTVM